MKKFFSLLIVLVMAFTIVPFFASCDYTGKESHNLDAASNGGSVVYKDGYIYFLGGIQSRDVESVDSGISGIYRVSADENKNITGEPEKIVSMQAGFEDGSLHIFGDYIYFATPSTAKSNTGEGMTDLTSFYRAKLDGTKVQKLYTTKEKSDDFDYAYYFAGEKELYLVTYENKVIYSSLIGSKVKTTKLTEDAETVLFVQKGESDLTNYIYYTKTPEDKDAVQSGNKVYRILPSGNEESLLSEGKNISLLEIKNDTIFYKIDKVMYKTTKSDFTESSVVSYVEYTKFLILDDGAIVAVNSSAVYYYKWNNGSLESKKLYSGDVEFVSQNGDYVLFVYNSYLYRINYKADSPEAEKLTLATINLNNSNSYPEILGSNIYYFTEEVLVDSNDKDYSVYHLAKSSFTEITSGGNEASRLVK